ncbi:insulinase family protein [Pseudomonas lundensis]|uniref:M16 family metallopeptidase n=1 Tax=Pseudomonas lundensis TaxID=86185 RepID=UPI0014728DDE|nr:pitrilysin family protein [Pseudomonas lundensis]NNA16515.1 insulinase family protein [Pseudomonas lundensis]
MTDLCPTPKRSSFLRAARSVLVVSLSLNAAAHAVEPVSTGLKTLETLDDSHIANRPLKIHAWSTHEGTGVLFIETREIPVVDLSVRFSAGSSRDDEMPGRAALTLKLLHQGIEGKDAQTIADTFDQLGAQLTSSVDKDEVRVNLRTLSEPKTRSAAVELFTQLVSAPAFSPAATERIKATALNELTLARQNPALLTQQALHAQLYAGHPYASAQAGNEQSIAKLGAEHLRAFHQQAYSASNALLVMVGDLSLDDATTLSIALSQALPQGPKLAPIALSMGMATRPGHAHVEALSGQTHIMLAQPGIPANHPDYVALQVASLLFGGSGHNRLINELRHKRGLTYSAASFMPLWEAGGPWTISVQTDPDHQEATIRLVKTLFEQWLDEGPTEQELVDVKRRLAGNLPLTSASNAQMLQQLLLIGAHGLPRNFDALVMQAQQLTPAHIKAVINRYLKADQWVITSHGPTTTQRPLPVPAP